MKRGKYKLKKRAERQEETRLRIARATLELHETLGPSLTTISAIAERAGVGRPTGGDLRPPEAVEGGLGRALRLLPPQGRAVGQLTARPGDAPHQGQPGRARDG